MNQEALVKSMDAIKSRLEKMGFKMFSDEVSIFANTRHKSDLLP